MESCPKYSDDDLRPIKDHFFGFSKKSVDFDKLTREFRDNDELSATERDKLLQEIRTRIECDMNITLLEAKKEPNKKNHYKCMNLLNIATSYSMNISIWQERIDKLFPIGFLRDKSLGYFQKSIDTIEEYLQKPSGLNHLLVFRDGYRSAKEYKNELQALGVPEEQLDKILNPVLERFIGIYLSEALKVGRLFLDGKSELSFYGRNGVTSWKKDFNDALNEYYGIKGNGSEEYQAIVRNYNQILPEILKIEVEIDIAIGKSYISSPMPGVK